MSSGKIANGVGVSPAQVRKDLSFFGDFGKRGVGYNVKDLMHYTKKILSLDFTWPLLLVGAGNLGYALCTHKGLKNRCFNIVGVFDNDLSKIGKRIQDLVVYPLEKITEFIEQYNVRIGIIAVPSSAAQEIGDIMVKNKIEAILNFAPVAIKVPDHIEVRNVDFSVKLEILTFNLSLRTNLRTSM